MKGICGLQNGTVAVELQSDRLAGLTHWQPGPTGPHEVALTVDLARFFTHYFSVFK